MRVVLATHGGQAAAINMRLPPRVLDSDRLPAEATAQLRDLVTAARAEAAPEKSGNARDAMSYTITVEDGDDSTTITASDTAMSPAFAALLTWLQTH
ncbi:hypothetical protein HH310_00860 [Actinoplanes sp. TBRC 11911]|uniref:protealysin inhibitor emfourin n=1 Tax=Actinoplanes sp. TBRC 11911 TaxID=2729386 RepID=UPI00145DB86A|nr:protealysin inhibitor emfourin [Actinoplanes sp. TBRC 11911]NMO49750.1 hypothetical protein [Actinoplanes sp. TBRC 11911]